MTSAGPGSTYNTWGVVAGFDEPTQQPVVLPASISSITGGVEVEWEDLGAISYSVYCGINPKLMQPIATGLNTNSYNILGLNKTSRYFIQVTAELNTNSTIGSYILDTSTLTDLFEFVNGNLFLLINGSNLGLVN